MLAKPLSKSVHGPSDACAHAHTAEHTRAQLAAGTRLGERFSATRV